MAQAIINALFNTIIAIVNTIMAPINLLIVNLFPDFSTALNNWTTSLALITNKLMAWFIQLIPPMTRNMIWLYLTFMISYYTISISVHAILKIWKIIKTIKVW